MCGENFNVFFTTSKFSCSFCFLYFTNLLYYHWFFYLNRKHATQPIFLRKLCHVTIRERYSKRTEEGYKNIIFYFLFLWVACLCRLPIQFFSTRLHIHNNTPSPSLSSFQLTYSQNQLKGQCHEIVDLKFFHESVSPSPPEYPIRTILKFFKNFRDIRSSRCTFG